MSYNDEKRFAQGNRRKAQAMEQDGGFTMDIILYTVAPLIGKIAIMVAIGFACKKMGLVTSALQKHLNDFAMQVILPFNILASCGNQFSQELSTGLAITAVISGCYYLAMLTLTTVTSKVMPLQRDEKTIFVMMSTFANVGFLGFPVAQELCGTEGTLYTVIHNVVYQLVMFSYGISLFNGTGKIDFMGMLKKPLMIISLCSVAIFLSPFRFPTFMQEAFTMVGDSIVPLSLILIGMSLADIPVMELLRDKYSYLVSLFRLVISPLMVYAGLRLFHVTGTVAVLAVVIASMPVGSLNVMLAHQYGKAPEFATRSLVHTMLFMFITLPVMIVLAMTLQ